ncbi:hypothetical protein PybrP1_005242 [[Pythium] brassicae (nom. inval.)]|nr:hypothetical protein PybrP1_005242 [[Pythium] brassicae (nom. inval.)]
MSFSVPIAGTVVEIVDRCESIRSVWEGRRHRRRARAGGIPIHRKAPLCTEQLIPENPSAQQQSSSPPTTSKMPVQIYANLISQPCRAVVWALKVKDADWELVQTDFGGELIKSDEFKAMNPSGFVPVLKDGDFTMFERYAVTLFLSAIRVLCGCDMLCGPVSQHSKLTTACLLATVCSPAPLPAYSNAIFVYIADKFGWTDLYPTDPLARAKVNEYLHWHHTNTRLFTQKIIRPLLSKKLGAPVTPEMLADIKKVDETMTKVSERLEKFLVKDFIAHSDAPTIADFAAYCEFDQLELIGYDFAKFPKVHAWLKRMEAVPHYDEVHAPLIGFLKSIGLSSEASTP